MPASLRNPLGALKPQGQAPVWCACMKLFFNAMRGAIAAAFILASFATAAMAQGDNRALVWGAIGVGAAVPTSGGEGIANMAELVFQKKPHHAAIRALMIHDIERPTNEIGELSALYGWTTTLQSFPVVIATGLSAVGFFDCPDDDDSCFTLGVPVVAEVSRNARFIGIGLQSFININSKASYAGGILFLKLGRLR